MMARIEERQPSNMSHERVDSACGEHSTAVTQFD